MFAAQHLLQQIDRDLSDPAGILDDGRTQRAGEREPLRRPFTGGGRVVVPTAPRTAATVSPLMTEVISGEPNRIGCSR